MNKNNKTLKIAAYIFMAAVVLVVAFFTFIKPALDGDIERFNSEQESRKESLSDSLGETESIEDYKEYYFRTEKQLEDHYKKHGKEMGFSSAEEYRAGACKVINNENSLHKYEKEDGDDIYYLESTNELVVVSTEGYIRTYFLPDDGINYYNKQ